MCYGICERADSGPRHFALDENLNNTRTSPPWSIISKYALGGVSNTKRCLVFFFANVQRLLNCVIGQCYNEIISVHSSLRELCNNVARDIIVQFFRSFSPGYGVRKVVKFSAWCLRVAVFGITAKGRKGH